MYGYNARSGAYLGSGYLLIMGNRLSRIYTQTGDATTAPRGSARGAGGKDSPRVEAFGTVDERNACLGLVLASANPPAYPGQPDGDTTPALRPWR